MNLILVIMGILIALPIFTLAVAFLLIFTQKEKLITSKHNIDFSSQAEIRKYSQPELVDYPTRDGSHLQTRHYPPKSIEAPLVVILHGSGWHSQACLPLADYLHQSTDFEILAPDLRGHGPNPKTRGDVDYIGQLEDDLADLIAHYQRPNQTVFMVGHSSGGGLVIRFAGGTYGAILSRAVLLAPYLQYNAPTARHDAGGCAHPLTRRIIGLSILNAFRFWHLNHLVVIAFNFPPKILQGKWGYTATTRYSYRLNTSYAPRKEYQSDIAKLPKFLLLAGTKDDAFVAEAYAPTMTQATINGEHKLIPDVDHLGILVDPKGFCKVAAFLQVSDK